MCKRERADESWGFGLKTGAIMFNDPLTTQQCEKLIRELAETVFPFQCAHGR